MYLESTVHLRLPALKDADIECIAKNPRGAMKKTYDYIWSQYTSWVIKISKIPRNNLKVYNYTPWLYKDPPTSVSGWTLLNFEERL